MRRGRGGSTAWVVGDNDRARRTCCDGRTVCAGSTGTDCERASRKADLRDRWGGGQRDHRTAIVGNGDRAGVGRCSSRDERRCRCRERHRHCGTRASKGNR